MPPDSKWDKYKLPEAGQTEAAESQWSAYKLPDMPGDSPDNPAQESVVSAGERAQITNLSPGQGSSVEWLRQRGYEAQENASGQISVRKPGGQWGVVDPAGADLGDVLDIGDELASGVGSVLGYGASKGRARGAGLGAAAAESLRQALGAKAGFEAPAGERAQAVALEGVLGATGEKVFQLGGKAVRGAARALRGKGRATPHSMKPKATPRDLADPQVTAPTSAVAGPRGDMPATVDKPGKPRPYLPSSKITRKRPQAKPTPKEPSLTQEELARQYEGVRGASVESIDEVVQRIGDEPMTIVFRKADGTIRETTPAYFKGPKFVEDPAQAAHILRGMPDDAVRAWAEKEQLPKKFLKNRETMMEGFWRQQPGLVQGKYAAKPRAKSPTAQTFWEHVVEGTTKAEDVAKARKGILTQMQGRSGPKDFGHWKAANKGRILEIRHGDDIIRFDDAGKPFLHKSAAGSSRIAPGRLRASAANILGKVEDALKRPAQLQDKLVDKVAGKVLGDPLAKKVLPTEAEGLKGFVARAARSAAPMAVPGYGGVAMAAKGAAIGGKAVGRLRKLLEQPGAVRELATNASAKTLELLDKVMSSRGTEEARRMAMFALLHQPDFRSWQEKYFGYRKRSS